MQFIKNIASKLLGLVILFFAIIGVITLFLFMKGYRPIIDPLVRPNWTAIGAIGQWAAAIVAMLIPIVVVYLSKSIEESVNNMSDKTTKTIEKAALQNDILTPEHCSSAAEGSVEYFSPTAKGKVIFDYSNNNGRYCIGLNELMFEIKFSKASNTNIYVYNDPFSISTIALVKDIPKIELITDARKYDTSSRTRCPTINQIVVLQNSNGFYAAIKILAIQDDTRGAANDEVTFEYIIQTNGSPDFSNI